MELLGELRENLARVCAYAAERGVTIATAASVWRPLAASQEAIAVDGLRFLRELVA